MSVITAPPILVSSSEIVLEQRPEGRASLKHLSKDQTVTAKVLQVVSNRRALLLIDGQKVSAKTFLPLQPGQTILLKVEQTGARQVFKFLGLPEALPGSNQRLWVGSFGNARPYVMLSQLLDGIRSFDVGDLPTSDRLAALKDLVAAMSLKSGVASDGFLKHLISGSGLLWESKLAAFLSKGEMLTPAAIDRFIAGDLKALALQLISGGGTLPEALSEQLKGVLEGLEQHQLLNQHLLDNEGRYLLPIPLAEQPSLKFGQLLLGLGDRKNSGDRQNRLVTVSFLLSLSQLGDLRADFSILKNGLTGAFGVAQEAARVLISSHLPGLRQKLQDHGYTVYDISCQVLEPDQLSEMSLVAQAVAPPSDGFLNLVV